VRPAILCGLEYWAVGSKIEQRANVKDMGCVEWLGKAE